MRERFGTKRMFKDGFLSVDRARLISPGHFISTPSGFLRMPENCVSSQLTELLNWQLLHFGSVYVNTFMLFTDVWKLYMVSVGWNPKLTALVYYALFILGQFISHFNTIMSLMDVWKLYLVSVVWNSECLVSVDWIRSRHGHIVSTQTSLVWMCWVLGRERSGENARMLFPIYHFTKKHA